MFPLNADCINYENDCGNGSRLCGVAYEPEPVYCPRRAEEGVLYGVVRENLETFLQRQEQRGRIMPLFVERELRSFLECPRCKGRMRILCAINPPEAIGKILNCLGLPTRPPPIFPARLADQFDYF